MAICFISSSFHVAIELALERESGLYRVQNFFLKFLPRQHSTCRQKISDLNRKNYKGYHSINEKLLESSSKSEVRGVRRKQSSVPQNRQLALLQETLPVDACTLESPQQAAELRQSSPVKACLSNTPGEKPAHLLSQETNIAEEVPL